MASHTPFADPSSFCLRQHLTDTTIGPAEMYALALVNYPDPDAIAVLCEHAAGTSTRVRSFRHLVGLYAAQMFDMLDLDAHAFDSVTRCQSRRKINTCTVDMVRRAYESDLLEGLRTARAVFSDGSSFAFRYGPVYVSDLVAACAPDAALTDRVVVEMSVMCSDGFHLSPELGREPRRHRTTPRDVRYTSAADWAVSRLLLSKFGNHVPLWDMFKHLYISEARIGAAVDLITELEQRNRLTEQDPVFVSV